LSKTLRRVVARRTILALAILGACGALLAHRSDEPFVFGYSLFYLLCLVFALGALAFTAVLFRRFKSRAWYVIGAIAIPLVLSAVVVEIFAQLYALRNPSYVVLSVQPDRVTGWKPVPNLEFTWAGPHWAAFEFSVPIVFNSAGFRDRERTIEKPADVVRVALLGDSLVEALQVPFDQTAGQLLERSLNAMQGERAPRYEVLNFGVSAYGLGQYLLNWEAHARAYKPDYVFAYVADFHMERTVNRGGMVTQGLNDLWTRPVFKLEAGKLIRKPAEEYEKFIAAQQRLIQNELGGKRMQKRRPGLFLRILLDELNTRVTSLQTRLRRRNQALGISDETVTINLRILEELAKSVNQAGGQLIIADTVLYHGGTRDLSQVLKALCARSGIGYVNVSDDLLKKRDQGISTARAYDGHFNEVGNEVFAAAMYRSLTSSPNAHASR
jgi:lysophospholipase L1-like esterase